MSRDGSEWDYINEHLGGHDEDGLPNFMRKQGFADDSIEGKSPRSYSSRRGSEFTPEQKRAYAIKKEEERRIFSTPIGRYIADRWGRRDIFGLREKMWTENESTYKSIEFSIGREKKFYMIITKCNDTNFTVEFGNLTGRTGSPLITKVSGNRLTPSLIEQAISKNDKLAIANARNWRKRPY